MVENMSRVVNFITVLLPSFGFRALPDHHCSQHQATEIHIPAGSLMV